MLREKEEELLKIIRENDNPEQAVMTAIKIFTAFLERPEEAPMLQPVDLPVSF
jgi:hypothetical protein